MQDGLGVSRLTLTCPVLCGDEPCHVRRAVESHSPWASASLQAVAWSCEYLVCPPISSRCRRGNRSMPLLNTVMNNRLVGGTARIRLERDALAPGARLNRPSALCTWRLFLYFFMDCADQAAMLKPLHDGHVSISHFCHYNPPHVLRDADRPLVSGAAQVVNQSTRPTISESCYKNNA